MTDRPIIFSGPMVRALLDGHKTQTRRLLPAPFQHLGREAAWEAVCGEDGVWRLIADTPEPGGNLPIRPGYQPGDRLYVREAHALVPRTAYRASIGTGTIDQREHPTDGYSAAVFREGFDRSGGLLWRPSIHMPRWASRLTLIVTDVLVQRLQDISEEDAVAEGMLWQPPTAGDIAAGDAIGPDDGLWIAPGTRQGFGARRNDPQWAPTAACAFSFVWRHLHGSDAWEANPWVCAITFTVHRANIDAVPTSEAA